MYMINWVFVEYSLGVRVDNAIATLNFFNS